MYCKKFGLSFKIRSLIIRGNFTFKILLNRIKVVKIYVNVTNNLLTHKMNLEL